MTGRLAGRTGVVTGGSTGIAQEIARRLAAEGADIAVADIDPAEETRELVAQTGRRVFSDKVDISDEDAIQEFAARVRRELGAADILVNNAAVVLLADIDHVTFDEWRRTFAVNVDGPVAEGGAYAPTYEIDPSKAEAVHNPISRDTITDEQQGQALAVLTPSGKPPVIAR